MFPSPTSGRQPEPDPEPDPEPEKKTVDDALRLDKVVQWRFDRLQEVGYTETQALMLALDRAEIDLHRAVDLAKKAGPTTAYRILT